MDQSSRNSASNRGEIDRLIPETYAELRAIAERQMRQERAGHTLQATALVHEAFMRLSDAGSLVSSPSAFYSAAAEAMRRILIEHARARGRLKRGGGADRVSLEAIRDVADLATCDEGILAFDEALERLEKHDSRFASVVKLRFFAGLSVADTAKSLGVSERTVNLDWTYARAWLAREIGQMEG